MKQTAVGNLNPARSLHKRTQKASTLMRGALTKPSGDISPKINRLNPGHNPQREYRAKVTPVHGKVDHFGAPAPKKLPHVSVSPKVITGEVINRSGGQNSATSAVALPSMIASVSHQKLERMLDEALTRADAHKQALRYQAARHFWQKPGFLGKRAGLKLVAGALSLLLIAGVIAWQKFPQLSVKMAAARAHITASVPSYKPAGFALAAPATAQNGAVLLKYAAGDGSAQSYDIAQKQSNMANASLAQTVVPRGAQVQTSQVAGNTVYIYGRNNDAAWVNNGVLYTLKDHAGLNSDEIIKIVQGIN